MSTTLLLTFLSHFAFALAQVTQAISTTIAAGMSGQPRFGLTVSHNVRKVKSPTKVGLMTADRLQGQTREGQTFSLIVLCVWW